MSKFNFIKNREKLSDKEIESKMDFDQFMKGYQAGNSWLTSAAKSVKLIKGIGLVAALAGIFYVAKTVLSKNESDPFINPPLEETRISPNIYSVDNTHDTIITYKTGSSIYIPASSFVDIRGNDVKGKVEIHYREFHNPFDIFLSGIPMKYDSANVTYQLETGGMMECVAFQDDKPLSLKPGKEITVNMISNVSANNYNIYYLDTAKRNWEFVRANSKENKTNLPLYDYEVVKEYEAEVNNNIEPAIPSIAKTTSANIELDYDETEFPELAVFDGIKFEVDPDDKNFDPALSKKTWDDVTVKKGSNSRKYVLTFTKGNELHEFNVAAVLEEKDFEQAQQEYAKKQEEYFALLEKKKNDEKYREQVMQSNYDKLMDVAEWSNVNKRVTEFIKKDIVNYAQLAIKTFQIKELGVWNSDHPYVQYLDANTKSKSPVITKEAFFTDKKGNILEVKNVYLVPADRNTLYGLAPKGNKIERFNYAQDEPYMLLAVTREGYPAYVSKSEFKNATAGDGDINFKLTVSDVKYKDTESLKAFMKM